ncbi:MAG: type I glyceraldehyde-3-phosphate dehydrogenase [Nanoarchaeota archaeon]
MTRVAINGLGRIGRTFLKLAIEKKIDVVAVNDLTDCKNLAYLLKYDSVYGVWHKKIEVGNNFLKIKGKKIIALSEKNPEKLPWKKLGVDIVIESTGFFTEKGNVHFVAGAKKVLITAPCKNNQITIVPGVNDVLLKKNHTLISVASCTTNCFVPIAHVLHSAFDIERGFMTTVHAYTADQRLQDAPHEKFRRGRAAAENLVPTTSGVLFALNQVMPELAGKIDGLAIRAPVMCGSLVDFSVMLKKSISRNEINAALKKAAAGNLKGIIEYSEDELVSRDVIGNPHSAVVDSLSTQIIDEGHGCGTMAKVLAWYDNEFGYSNRLVDVVGMVKI